MPFDAGVDRQFPSWTWAAWRGSGSNDYRLFAEMGVDEPLPNSLIKEFFIAGDGKPLRRIPGREQQGGMVTNPEGSEADHSPIPSPALPYVLQFVAPTLPLTAFTISSDREPISSSSNIHSTTMQYVRAILDPRGKRCGLWWEQSGYVYVGRSVSPTAEAKMIFVAVNQHAATYQPRKGPSRVEGEIRLFDEEVYPPAGPGSGLVNVLAVDEDMGHEYGERITVARIHEKAWEEAGPAARMVRLA